jgi:hypothetical protein
MHLLPALDFEDVTSLCLGFLICEADLAVLLPSVFVRAMLTYVKHLDQGLAEHVA